MKIYIAGLYGEAGTYAGGIEGMKRGTGDHLVFSRPFNMLESFYYFKPWQVTWIRSPANRSFMLDSGAYTFRQTKTDHGITDFDGYLQRYISFINEHKVDLFFELDIDALVGLKKVEEYREILEQETGKQSIPVWHKSRGTSYFVDMCKEYPYVSIGGLFGESPKSKFPAFPWFIRTAHKHGAKIHALGLGSPTLVMKYPFDSSDSTSWNTARVGGKLFRFNGAGLDSTLIDSDFKFNRKEVVMNNLTEWIKFSYFMEGQPT